MQVLVGYTKSPYFFAGLMVFGMFATYSDASMLLEPLFGPRDTRYQGHLPNSLLTLNYPYTLMRGVVMEQPVSESDVPFFWHAHKSDERILDKVLSSCYGVETVKLDSPEEIQKAKDVKISSRKVEHNKFAILSPLFREVIETFTPDHLGRAVCFFRHPLDYDFHAQLQKKKDGKENMRTDNFLVRYLLDDYKKDVVGFKELGDAKQIVRDVCVVSIMDKTTESIERAAAYFGWDLAEGASESCVEDVVDALNPTERYVDHDTPEWDRFYGATKFDCQVYEFAQQAWRAQIQTIVPFALQQRREEQRLKQDE